MKKVPPRYTKGLARSLRSSMSEAEKKLWRHLKLKQMHNFKFRKQVPVGKYIADFVCHEAKLLIEIDGGQHNLESDYEIKRTAFLKKEGYHILRFWNNEVLKNIEGVCIVIINYLDNHHPHPFPSRGRGIEING